MRAIRRVLGEAFAPDPLLVWLFPDDATRLDATAAWLGLFAERFLTRAPIHAIVGDDVAAVALWQQPGETALPVASGPPTIGGMLAALLGPARSAELGDALRAMRRCARPGAIRICSSWRSARSTKAMGWGTA